MWLHLFSVSPQPVMDYLKLAGAGVVTVGAAAVYYFLQPPDAPELAVDLRDQSAILSVSLSVLCVMSYISTNVTSRSSCNLYICRSSCNDCNLFSCLRGFPRNSLTDFLPLTAVLCCPINLLEWVFFSYCISFRHFSFLFFFFPHCPRT